MKAVFTCAAVYQVTAKCVTPLRTGGADGDPENVLKDGTGRAFLQGTSLSGAMRNWMMENLDGTPREKKEKTERLMGKPSQVGHLVVSDAFFDTDVLPRTRPRLCIDHDTATAKDGGKFDVAHIPTGSRLTFSLTWMGDNRDRRELDDVELVLAALNAGQIQLGGQKTNGFGQVQLTVLKRFYDMTKEADRTAWLERKKDGKPLTLPAVRRSKDVCFTVRGIADSVLIRAAAVEQDEERSYTPNQTENDRVVLPGSSIKGVVRSRATTIAASMGKDQAWIDSLFGRGSDRNERERTEEGDNGLPGRVRFEDVKMDPSKKKIISRIRINRFTGGVIRGGLFQEEPVSGQVMMKIVAPDEKDACALVLYALRDMGIGLYNLGSGGSIGRGYLRLREITMEAPGGRSATMTFNGLECSLKDPKGLVNEWIKALGGANG